MNLTNSNLIKEDEEYLKNKKINYIFRELLNKILLEKPENFDSLKLIMINELKKLDNINEKETFFTEEDFEKMFDNFDIFKKGEISINYFFKTWEYLKIPYEENIIINKYKLNYNELLKKKIFIRLIKREYIKLFKLDN